MCAVYRSVCGACHAARATHSLKTTAQSGRGAGLLSTRPQATAWTATSAPGESPQPRARPPAEHGALLQQRGALRRCRDPLPGPLPLAVSPTHPQTGLKRSARSERPRAHERPASGAPHTGPGLHRPRARARPTSARTARPSRRHRQSRAAPLRLTSGPQTLSYYASTVPCWRSRET